jgi:hypothetical protein
MPTKFNLSSPNALGNEMIRSLVARLTKQHGIYQSRWFLLLIGCSKILNATVLMLLYMWHRTWDEKFSICIFFVVLSCLTYLAEGGVGLVWWPGWRKTFYKPHNNAGFVLCTKNPFYSDRYQIRLYVTPSTSLFQRLPEPVVNEEFTFPEFFTESGYFLEDKWTIKVDQMVKKLLAQPSAAKPKAK